MVQRKNILDEEKAKEIVKNLIQSTGGVIEIKKSGHTSRFIKHLHQIAKELGYITDYDVRYPNKLTDPDILKCIEKIWDYVLAGVLAPGWGPSSGYDIFFPYLHITEYGAKVMRGVVNPYLVEDYVNEVKAIAPNLIDDVSEMYLFEATKSFKFNVFLGAMVLLGGFSERVFLNFIDEFKLCVQDQHKQKKIDDQNFISGKFNEVLKIIKPLKKQLPRNVKHQLDLWLNSFFNYVRQTRNQVGHPTGKEMSREELHGMLLIFPTYVKNLVELLNHFRANPIT